MMSKIYTKSKQYLKEFEERPNRNSLLLKQLLESPHFQSWIYFSEIIKAHAKQNNNTSVKQTIKQTIQSNFKNVKSFAMLMFVYSLQIEGVINLEFVPWSTLYQDLCVTDNEILIFNSWAFNPQTYQQKYYFIQNTLQMIAKHWPQFLVQNKIPFTDLEFDSIVQWILRMRTQTPQKFELAYKLSLKIREINIVKHDLDYVSKQHLVIKKLIQNAGDTVSCSGNGFLLLQPQKYYADKQINYFCHIYYEYLDSLNQDYLKKVFTNLVAGGVTKVCLNIILKISQILSTNEEYFKLRHIYQNFILTHLTNFKAHAEHSAQVFDLVEFYVLGFLKHCDIGINGIDYLLQGLQDIDSPQLAQKWVKMILAVSLKNEFYQKISNALQQKGFAVPSGQINDKKIDQFVDINKIWNVTLRTGKKHKKYNKFLSDFKGIQNKANECYIISVVQGLFLTKQLQKLLDFYRNQIKDKHSLLDELRVLFSQLQGKRKANNIVISYLKSQGPEVFRLSNRQQDTMQYLIQLFDCIETDCKKMPGMVQKFKQIFKIDCQHTTKCLNCQKQTTNIQDEYIHTIPHTKLLHLKIQEQVQDYKCQQCNKVGHCTNIRVISPKCKIFIVHINRFSFKKEGICKKQLSNQTILRQFLDYELVGMVCHIGKTIDSGHYIYFSKVGPKKWVQMNDRIAYKFEIQDEQEQFERQMKNDMSPYILFYRKMADFNKTLTETNV